MTSLFKQINPDILSDAEFSATLAELRGTFDRISDHMDTIGGELDSITSGGHEDEK